ncbi:uncharacterized protein LOC128406205 isoform X4 [Podarcis raffonei]|uniref:uncharacterized protein LOC128406205 isoform X4 n=1 Tax=Podarcis raffonei TaxID=65483 RepID=UPI0023292968|nr:uncharacterized protein LOC128406205 isoform X4 [Podarcis raffonei]
MISMAQRKTQFRSVSSTSCFTATPFDSNTWLLSSCDALICVPSAEESASYNNSQPPPFGYNSTVMMKGIITIAEKAATILSRTITVEIIVGSENIIIGSKGTETKRKQANTSHGVSSMRAKNVKTTRRTSTRRKKSHEEGVLERNGQDS